MSRPLQIALKITELQYRIAELRAEVRALEAEYPAGPESSRDEVSPRSRAGASHYDCRSERVAPASIPFHDLVFTDPATYNQFI